MTKERIVEIIKKNIVDNVDAYDVSIDDIDITKTMRDYGANSLDLIEVVSCSMRELNIKIPMAELADIGNIEELADKFYVHAQQMQYQEPTNTFEEEEYKKLNRLRQMQYQKPTDSIDDAAIVETVQKLSQKKDITVLLVGRTGVGKSSTINSLLGKEVAPVGDDEPETRNIGVYSDLYKGKYNYTIIDTPGLCDDLPEMGHDDRYLAKIKSAVTSHAVDIVWFVTTLDDTRVRGDERQGLQFITKALGERLWDHSIIVFTNADKVSKERFEEKLKTRSRLIRDAIARHSPGNARAIPSGMQVLYANQGYNQHSPGNARAIPSVAVTNEGKYLPNGEPWIGELFTQTFIRLHDAAYIPFFLSLQDDIGKDTSDSGIPLSRPQMKSIGQPAQIRPKPRIPLSRSQEKSIKKSFWERIKEGWQEGAAAGEEIGGYLGKSGGFVVKVIGGLVGVCGGILDFFFDW